MLNTNGVVDLRSNLAGQTWTQVVLQEQIDEPLAKRAGLGSNPDWFNAYSNTLEDFVHQGTAYSGFERDLFAGATEAARTAACRAATGASATTCNTERVIPANLNASAATQMFLYQTWARPNLVDGALVTSTNTTTGAVTRSATPATTCFSNLEAMTEALSRHLGRSLGHSRGRRRWPAASRPGNGPDRTGRSRILFSQTGEDWRDSTGIIRIT